MTSFSLSPDTSNRDKSAEFAAAMAAYERGGGRITHGECFTGNPVPPKRRDWIDPETVLKRKARPMTLAQRRALGKATGAL